MDPPPPLQKRITSASAIAMVGPPCLACELSPHLEICGRARQLLATTSACRPHNFAPVDHTFGSGENPGLARCGSGSAAGGSSWPPSRSVEEHMLLHWGTTGIIMGFHLVDPLGRLGQAILHRKNVLLRGGCIDTTFTKIARWHPDFGLFLHRRDPKP